jgi:hypothetical protein
MGLNGSTSKSARMAEIGIPLERFSEDKARVNKYGQKLVELCKRCSLYIANGILQTNILNFQEGYKRNPITYQNSNIS